MSITALAHAFDVKTDDKQAFPTFKVSGWVKVTYQDTIYGAGGWSFYQLRVNDLASVAGGDGAQLAAWNSWSVSGAKGVWPGLPKGELNLSIWHRQSDCSACEQNSGGFTTNVTVMEIEH